MLFSVKQGVTQLLPPAATSKTEVTPPSFSPFQVTTREQRLKPAELFCGDPELCERFILQFQLAFQTAPLLYSTDAAKISFKISQLKGVALRWAQPICLHVLSAH